MKTLKRAAISLSVVLGLLVIGGVWSQSVFAQTGTASVRGTVRDPQGNVVSGATITLKNEGKNFSRTQVTSGDGTYVFTAVPPDTYQVEVESTGFKKVSVPDVRALVDTPTDVDIALEVGAVTETVVITTANEAPLNTTDASIGTAIESRRIQELPLNARNIVGLLSLQPGVTREGEVNGSRRDQANITLDGVDVNEQQTGLDVVNASTTVTPGDAFSSVIRVNPDSVQEFRVTTSNPAVSQGRVSGAQVSLVTKSGTNNFHGSLYWFHRNTVTTANDWFNNQAGRFIATDAQVIAGTARVGDLKVPRPKLLRNIFGGSLGGPLKQDRAFFFYSYEGRRDAAAVSVLRTVPSATLRNGIIQYRNTAGGISTLTQADITARYPQMAVAGNSVNPAALSILQTAPLPNDTGAGDGRNTGGFRFNAPISTALESHVARLDFNLTANQMLFVRANYQDDLHGRAPNFPTTPSPSLWVHPKGIAFGHTWTATSRLVNNARFGLTRLALSQQGDSNATSVSFREVYTPFLYQRSLNRDTPVWNFTDDVSWIKGSHTFGFGGNIRVIRNNRENFASSFDAVLTNPFFYFSGGSSLLTNAPSDLSSGGTREYQIALAAVLGRSSQSTVNKIFDKSGQPLAVGSPAIRSLATEEYEVYAGDTWSLLRNLTLTMGLRYSVNTPVYERQGFQLVPNLNLGDVLERRTLGMAAGQPFNDPIAFNLGGKANNGPDFYEQDNNNFAPSIGIAWSPDFGDNALGRLLGRNGRSVIRGGFRILYDRVGSQLAVSAESENSFGFSSSSVNGSSFFHAINNPPPRITSLNPDVRTFPGVNAPNSLTFPVSFPSDGIDRIRAGIDQSLVSPVHYTWNASYGRELPAGLAMEISYVGRAGRNLLLIRDVMQLNNIRDPASGMDWYAAAGRLNDLRLADASLAQAGTSIPFFQNLFPNLGPNLAATFGIPFFATLTPTQAAFALHSRDVFDITDFTAIQQIIDDEGRFPNMFFHPQYAALQTLSSVGRSDYHGGTFSLRQRLGNSMMFDFNYTMARSMDDGSPLETLRVLSNTIRNPFNQELEYSVSDFDIRHGINFNWLAELPFGRGRRYMSDLPTPVNALLGGWQFAGIMRYHTGMPTGSPGDAEWATNWQLTSNGVRQSNVTSANVDVTNAAGITRPNLFADPIAAYRSFRNARAGEVGDRNIDTLRLPSYFVLDASLSKSFNMWYAEGHRLQFRWEVFNVTNTQPFGVLANLTLNPEPFRGQPPSNFGTYIGSQTPVGETRPGRVMQFAFRYQF